MTTEKMLSFVEHLVELRKRLIVVIIAIVIGMGIAWNLSSEILTFIEKPLTGHTYLTELKEDVYRIVKERYPGAYSRFDLGKKVPGPK